MTDYIDCLQSELGGFNFDNQLRNDMLLASKEITLPSMKKTGTTICGVVCKNCVVLAADTRATAGTIVADKNCSKLHKISDRIYCAGAGTSADLCHTTQWLEYCIALHSLNTKTDPRVDHVVSLVSHELFKYSGHKQCALVLGGVDINGPHLYSIHPHGSTDRTPFVSMGSGSLHALAVLETGYRDGMSVDEAEKLVIQAISAGILNDLGSGGNVDVCIITSEETRHCRAKCQPAANFSTKRTNITFPIGTTSYLREKVEELKKHIIVDVEMTQA